MRTCVADLLIRRGKFGTVPLIMTSSVLLFLVFRTSVSELTQIERFQLFCRLKDSPSLHVPFKKSPSKFKRPELQLQGLTKLLRAVRFDNNPSEAIALIVTHDRII